MICVAAGGTLEVNSQPMVGSDFTFTMNVKENDKPKSSESSKSSKKSKTINTLIQ